MSDFKLVKLLDPLLVALGVPVGGTTGQILKKASNANYDTVWASGGGGGGGQVDSIVAGEGVTVVSTDPVNPVVSVKKTYVLDPAVAGVGTDQANPYILGTNSETYLQVARTNIGSSAPVYVLLTRNGGTVTPFKDYRIDNISDGPTWIGFFNDGTDINGQGNELSLAGHFAYSGNDLSGWQVSQFMTALELRVLDTLAGAFCGLYHGGIYNSIEHVSWQGGADKADGQAIRYTLNTAQYTAGFLGNSADSLHYHLSNLEEVYVDPLPTTKSQLYILSDGIASPNNHRTLRVIGSTGTIKDIMDWIE